MELEYFISIKENCQLAKMKAYKKWMKASRKWENSDKHSQMYTCERRDTGEGKRTNTQNFFVQWVFCFSCKFVPICLLSIQYISKCMCVCVYICIHTHTCVCLCTYTDIFQVFLEISPKIPFMNDISFRNFILVLFLGIILSAIILN